MTAEAIQAWLVSRLSTELGIDPGEIDIREPFASYGLDSVRAVSLSGDLEDWLGRRLSPTLAYEYPTIESLARYLAGEPDTVATHMETGGQSPAGPEPIAIIGIGCRFPGAPDADAFWRLLRDGSDAVTEVPADRWDVDTYYAPDPATPGKMNTRWGGFLQQVDLFDPQFFGISPREASRMDPQQRLLLEVAWEALEDAGQVPERLTGTRTCVFIGISSNDYGQLQLSDPSLSDAYAGTGNALSIAANRISYLFNLRGPSLAIDTACSSSLVAVHLACQSLQSGEATLAVAGGVNVILSPAITVNFTQAGFMAPDGRCKAFDARANGYVRGEGAGIVILKPLVRALEDGDPICAVILGSAVNSDGRTNGLTAPNQQAQEAVLREAYRRAAVSPGQVQYVECHGTGTALGDPIEAMALGRVLASDRLPGRRCAIGSVKTNIGHLEAAAGIAGLIKTVLSLKHRAIPPSLHYHSPNPLISFDDLPLRVQHHLGAWDEAVRPAIAGVSAFGFGGTNAHVVLAEAPEIPGRPHRAEEPGGSRAHLLPLSARNPDALRSLARAHGELVSSGRFDAGPSLADMCYASGVRRGHHDHRLAIVFHSREELADRLETFLRGEKTAGVSSGRRIPGHRSKLVFVFSGQGPQWVGMGRDLLEREPAFRATMEQCNELLRELAGWSLLDGLAADTSRSRLEETEFAQPAIFALQVALAALWRSWGIEPDAVVGHSAGEVAAAHVAGVLSLRDAVRVIFHRGRLMERGAGKGRMAALELPLADVARALTAYGGRLTVAAINSPSSTVVAGDPVALEEFLQGLRQKEIFCRLLPVNYAFHSPGMEPLQRELAQALEGLGLRPASLTAYSTVTGTASTAGVFDGAYWARNIREPVLFAAAVDGLVQTGRSVFLEIGPHPVLAGAISQCLRHRGLDGTVLPSLRRNETGRAVMLGSLGALYALGQPVDWDRLYPDGGRCVRLPSYPWQRERYWLEPPAGQPNGQRLGTRQGVRVAERRPHAADDLDDWLYEIGWEPAARVVEQPAPATLASAVSAGARGPWLILADNSGVGVALAELATAHGERCALAPAQSEDLRRVLDDALGSEQAACRGVVYLGSLDTPPSEETTVASPGTALTVGCERVLRLVQELERRRWIERPRLWLVTRGAQAVEERANPLAVSQAPVWGFGRTIAYELPALWGGLVDLEPQAAATAHESAAQLWAELRNPASEETQLAFRGGQRYAARLRKHRLTTPGLPLQWRTDGSYLVTGGLGDLGLQVARWMIEQGARRIILLGRTQIPPRSTWNQVEKGSRLASQLAAVRELESLGASVHLASVDVADAGLLASFLEAFRDEGWPPIRGLVHAAGVLQDRTLLQLDRAALDAVFRAKALGAWNLHRLLEDAPLDFFVLFSSAAALLGSPGQANYAAANAFLDALAHHRRALGRPALSINWGPWAGVGLAARPDRTERFARLGIGSIAPDQGLDILDRLLTATSAQVGVVPGLSNLLRDGPGGLRVVARPTQRDGLTRAALLAAAAGQRREMVEADLREQVAAVLQLPVSKLDVDQPLNTMGLDSLMAVQLKNQIEATLGVGVSLVRFLEGSSVSQVATQLLDDLETVPSVPVEPARKIDQPRADELLARLDQLSEDEVDALLNQMLNAEDVSEP